MAYKISISGIDGCGKSTLIPQVVDHYAKGQTVVKFGRPIYVQKGDERIYIARWVSDISDRVHMLCDEINFRTGVGIVNIGYGAIHSLIGWHILKKYDPSLIITGRDPILDSAVYSTYYFPPTKHISSGLRLKLTKEASQEDYPDGLLFMAIPVEVALERIEKRIQAEQVNGDNIRGKKSGICMKILMTLQNYQNILRNA